MTVSRSYCNCNECISQRSLTYRIKYYAKTRQTRIIDFIKFYAQNRPKEELLSIEKGICEGISIASLVFSPSQWRNLMDILHSIPSIPEFYKNCLQERVEWVKTIKQIKTDLKNKNNPNKQHQIIEQTRQKQHYELSNLYAFLMSIYWYQIQDPISTFKNKKLAFAVIDNKLHWVGDLCYVSSLTNLRNCFAIINRVLAENDCHLPSRFLISAGMHKARISYEPNLRVWFVMDPNFPFGIFFATRNIAQLAATIFAMMEVPVQSAMGLRIEYFFYGDQPPKDLFLKIEYTLQKEGFKFSYEKIKQLDYFGIDLLFLATLNNNKVLVEAILKTGVAHINQINLFGYTSLYAAVRCGYLEIVKLLLNNGASPNVINSADLNKMTALQLAIQQGNNNIVFWLLLAGADPNIQTEHEYSALHIAADRGDIIGCDLLLRAGADTRLLDHNHYERQIKNYSNQHNRITFFQPPPLPIQLGRGGDMTRYHPQI